MQVHESGWQKKGKKVKPHVAAKVDEATKEKLLLIAKDLGISLSALVSHILVCYTKH